MADKRVIEQTASSEIYNDDWFLKDSVLNGTTKISAENLAKGLIDNVDASDIAYDNSSSGLTATNVQDAIDETFENAGKVDDVKVDGTSVVTNKVAEIEIPVKDVEVDGTSVVNASGVAEITLPDVPVQDVQVKTDSTYDSVVDASGNAKIDLSSVTAYGEVPNLPQPIATFKDGADAPMKSLKVAIEPQQDLHGYDAPWAGGSGRNLFSVGSRVDGTIADVRYTSDDEYIYLNGTKQGIGYADLSSASNITLDSGTYYIRAFVISGTASNTVELYAYDGTNNLTGNIINNERTLTLSESKTFRFRFAIWTDGTALNNYKVGIVISKTPNIDKFYPYSNICPISGWDEANVTVADDVETPTVSNVYTIDLDGTRYGGELDVTSGVLTVDRVIVTFDDSGWTEGEVLSKTVFQRPRPSAIPSATNFISNFIKRAENLSGSDENVGYFGASYFNVYVPSKTLAEWKTLLSSTNMEIVYLLATPTTIQLTPTQVKSLLGSNNVWADTGDINDCIYRRDMSSTIDDIIARLEALEG